jgi:arginyl-tRNA synthetase
MILPIHNAIRDRLSRTLTQVYAIAPEALPALLLESPPNRALGDLATPVAFELARRLRKAPRAIAQEIAAAIGTVAGVRRVEAAPNGYLNIFLDRPHFLATRLTEAGLIRRAPEAGKTIVEHTAINPNKSAHVGHLRNAALGDTLVRVLRFRGGHVEVQNYIDDTGVQVADVVVGFRHLEGASLDAIKQIANTTRFDYYCWDLYARVTEWYEQDKSRLEIRAATMHDIEHGTEDAAAIAHLIADRIVRCHLKTMARMNVDYDLLTWEGDILRLQFWTRAFEILKQKRAVYLQDRGRLAGCWVMRIEDEPEGDSEADAEGVDDDRDAEETAESREKVIVRSNGTVTYVGKDIAYQLWKFGLLGCDFHYRVFAERAGGGPLWATSAAPDGTSDAHPPFGRASATYNVIDVGQSYLQKLLQQALAALGYPEQAERAIHFSYEKVGLSQVTARALGYTTGAPSGAPGAPRAVGCPSEDGGAEKRGFVGMSGRKGQGVKADDLLDTVIERAGSEVDKRNPELRAAERQRIAEAIGVAAVRYFMIKYSRTKVIAFDIEEALNFEGESGPYLQYAVVRAQNIFNKLREREGVEESAITRALAGIPAQELEGEEGSHDLWALVLEAARLDEIVEQVVRTLEFSVLAKYAFGLAQTFNAFYHRYPILNEERADIRRWRAAGVSYFRRQLARTLDLMGIAVPPRM